MILNTRRLFIKLLRTLRIDTVCDIGSMNGDDARAFRDASPRATVIAFEANPANAKRMLTDRLLTVKGIEVVPRAVTNRNGEADFFALDADYSTIDGWRGMGSLYRRIEHTSRTTVAAVKTTRLDTFLSGKLSPYARLALWIDAEGKAYEVVDGAAGLALNIQLLHVEVETCPCIAPEQRLYPEVKNLVDSQGLGLVATDHAPDRHQFNALFIRRNMEAMSQIACHLRVTMARARFLGGRPVRLAQRIAAKAASHANR